MKNPLAALPMSQLGRRTPFYLIRPAKQNLGLLIQAACWMSNFTDAKSFIVKAKKISKTRDVQILELLFEMKVNNFQHN